MTKKKLLAKAKEMGLDVTDALTKAQIQAAINDAESVEVEVEETTEFEVEVEAEFATEDDVVIELTKGEAEEVLEKTEEAEVDDAKQRLDAVAVAQTDLAALIVATKSELYDYAKENDISIHRGLSQKEAFRQVKRGIISRLKKPL